MPENNPEAYGPGLAAPVQGPVLGAQDPQTIGQPGTDPDGSFSGSQDEQELRGKMRQYLETQMDPNEIVEFVKRPAEEAIDMLVDQLVDVGLSEDDALFMGTAMHTEMVAMAQEITGLTVEELGATSSGLPVAAAEGPPQQPSLFDQGAPAPGPQGPPVQGPPAQGPVSGPQPPSLFPGGPNG